MKKYDLIVVGAGNGPGLTPRTIGEMSGTETNTLLISNLPPHNHSINAVSTISDFIMI